MSLFSSMYRQRWAVYEEQFHLSARQMKRLRKSATLLDQMDGCKDDAARRLVLGIFGGTRDQDSDDGEAV